MIFMKYINEFKNYLIARGYSGRTCESYDKSIQMFFSFLTEHYPRIKEPGRITNKVLNDYCYHLTCRKTKAGTPLSNNSHRRYLAAIKGFFKFLSKQDYILKNPTTGLELPKQTKKLPKNILTEKEVMQILDAPDIRTPKGMRDKALLEVCYACGIRTSELINLKIADVDLNEQTILIIKGKGGKTRLVPLTQYATEYIKLYLEKGRKFLLKGTAKDDGILFLTNIGNKINRTDINKAIIKPIIKQLNIKKDVTIYSFRHSVASHLIKKGVDIRFVAELLGHSSVNTTQVYCHLDITDLKKVHSLLHPRERD